MNMLQAMSLVRAERNRQKEVEGWSIEHDDAHADGAMALAAGIYFLHAEGRCTMREDGIPMGWPWDAAWWKPKTPERDLVRAGALYLAEQERLQRLPGSFGLKRARGARIDPKIKAVLQRLCRLQGDPSMTEAETAAHGSPRFANLQHAINSIPDRFYWLIGKGRTRPSEPLYAIQLLDPESGVAIVETEGENLVDTIAAAIGQLTNSQRPEGK